MTNERWLHVKALFLAALERPVAERAAFLDAADIDHALRREVESLLQADIREHTVMDQWPFRETPASSPDQRFGPALKEWLVGAGESPDPIPALAPGNRLGPYEIISTLGIGGMGEVYRAHDPRLHRDVAIKILPPPLAEEPERLVRFQREARLLASLNHPHIAAIYDIERSGAIDYLVLELVDGHTLQGPIALEQALDYADQIADALEAAHGKGVIHRDLKPANIKVASDGGIKVLDFGLAKDRRQMDRDEDGRGRERHDASVFESVVGRLVGSPAYMSPEQTRGDQVDERTDVWAFGSLLYELLAGKPAFGAESLPDTIEAVQSREPDWSALPAAVPPRVRELARRCLEKDPARRPRAMREVRRAIADARRGANRWRVAAIMATALILLMLVTGGLAIRRSQQGQWAREVAIPEVMQLIAADEYDKAFALANQIDSIVPDQPVLATLWPRFSAAISLTTVPDGAAVFVRSYAASDAGWESLGRTPLKGVRIPNGVFQIRIEKEGYEPRMLAATNPSTLLGNATNRLAAPVVVHLTLAASAPGMVEIPGGAFPVSLNAFSTTDPISLDSYLIDRFEVTNGQYQQFVDANGYEQAAHWEDLPFELAGRRVSWDEAVAQFRDSTGAAGPATWASGRYTPGTAANPVGGVSWYEAVAYCRSQAKTLPTLYHWRRAALAPDEMFAPMAPAIIERSNFEQRGAADVGTFKGLGPYGTYDMAGNVREWSWNEAQQGDRWIQGGSWREPTYMLVVPDRAPASDRSPTNGFRCARYGNAIPERLLARLDRPFFQLPQRAAIPQLFDVFKNQYQPITAALNPRVEGIDATRPEWTKEKVSFDAGYEDARVAAYLFIPRTAKPPYQAVVYFPGRSSFVGRSRSDALQPDMLDFVVDSGRVLVWPIYQGSYERWIPTAAPSATGRRILSDWRQDLARVIELLSQRPDIDATRIAYLGLSYGASVPVPLLALEDRFKAVVLMSASAGGVPGFADADALDYLSHITMPVLLLSGKHDFVFPLETVGKPLFARLGTRPDDKRHVVFDAGHMMFPRGPMHREVLTWLDRYLGPVARP